MEDVTEDFMDKALEVFNELWAVELYRGVILAVGGLLALLIVYWIIKLIVFVKFGRHRCSSVSVKNERGSIVASCETITAVLRSELKKFPELEIRRILIFCKRGVYSMELRCVYFKVENFRGVPELFAAMEPLIRERMKDIFGLDNIAKVDIRIVGSGDFDELNSVDDLSIHADSGNAASPEARRV